MKLNLGAGSDIREGWINQDVSELPGVDVVHDLNDHPWPFEDSSVDELLALNVLEHLDDLVPALEEMYRILRPGGAARLMVPYWNSWHRYADPTHQRGFHEFTLRFFDPDSSWCKDRPYYSNARFRIEEEAFAIAPLSPYLRIPGVGVVFVTNGLAKKMLKFFANIFCNVILSLRYELRKV